MKFVISWYSDSTAFKTDMILWWTSPHGLGNSFKNHRLWTQLIAASTSASWNYHAKKKTIYSIYQIQEHCLPPLDLCSFKMGWGRLMWTVVDCRVVWQVKHFKFFLEIRDTRNYTAYCFVRAPLILNVKYMFRATYAANMTLYQLFWNVLLAWNSKWAIFI